MEVVYKYKVEIAGVTTLRIPQDAKILKVDSQGDGIYIWVHVNTENITVERSFVIFATGEPLETNSTYIGTAKIYDGRFLWHVFEV